MKNYFTPGKFVLPQHGSPAHSFDCIVPVSQNASGLKNLAQL